jgi:hypothetical protein
METDPDGDMDLPDFLRSQDMDTGKQRAYTVVPCLWTLGIQLPKLYVLYSVQARLQGRGVDWTHLY